MKYVIAQINGKQYQLSEGDELLIDKLRNKLEYKVLLFVDGDNVKIGKPRLDSLKLKFAVDEETELGKKVNIRKYKAKSRYRKAMGFRPKYSKINLQKIS